MEEHDLVTIGVRKAEVGEEGVEQRERKHMVELVGFELFFIDAIINMTVCTPLPLFINWYPSCALA